MFCLSPKWNSTTVNAEMGFDDETLNDLIKKYIDFRDGVAESKADFDLQDH